MPASRNPSASPTPKTKSAPAAAPRAATAAKKPAAVRRAAAVEPAVPTAPTAPVAAVAAAAPVAETAEVAKTDAAAVPALQEAEPNRSKPGKKPGKPHPRPVRDGFTMPQADFDLIAALKQQALKQGVVVKKSELLRAGLHALKALSDAALLQVVADLAPVKTGRPKK